MRMVTVLIGVGLLLIESGLSTRLSVPNSTSRETIQVAAVSRIDFDSDVKPIFKSKCMPCHFEGGKMYESLPFDRPETIRKLGDRLLTRIKDENDRRMIKEFLAQSP